MLAEPVLALPRTTVPVPNAAPLRAWIWPSERTVPPVKVLGALIASVEEPSFRRKVPPPITLPADPVKVKLLVLLLTVMPPAERVPTRVMALLVALVSLKVTPSIE